MATFNLTKFRDAALPSESELIAKWTDESISPKVSFICTTFNHEEYLEDAIRGFLIQETIFSFEILIHDDASTDKSADIILHYCQLYPNIISCTLQSENQYSRDRHFPFHSMFDKAKGKYIAICEGDDFWICKNKISNQVNILEDNSNLALVYSKAYIYLVVENNVCSGLVGKAMNPDSIYSRNRIPTLTTMFKKDSLSGFVDYLGNNQKNWLQSDYQLWLWLNLQGELFFEDKITSVYRVLTSSASRPKDIQAQYNFRLSVLSTSVYFSSRNAKPNVLKTILLKNHFFLYLWCLKRKLPQAQFHKDEVLKQLDKRKATSVRFILNFLVEKTLIPVYFQLCRLK